MMNNANSFTCHLQVISHGTIAYIPTTFGHTAPLLFQDSFIRRSQGCFVECKPSWEATWRSKILLEENSRSQKTNYPLWKQVILTYIVDCPVVVQLGSPDPWYDLGGPAKVGAHKYFLFTESSLVVITRSKSSCNDNKK